MLLSSGYNEQDVIQRFAGKGLTGFIQKPYQSAALLAALRQVLADPVPGAGTDPRPKEGTPPCATA